MHKSHVLCTLSYSTSIPMIFILFKIKLLIFIVSITFVLDFPQLEQIIRKHLLHLWCLLILFLVFLKFIYNNLQF